MPTPDSLVTLSHTAVDSSAEGLTVCFSRTVAQVGQVIILSRSHIPTLLHWGCNVPVPSYTYACVQQAGQLLMPAHPTNMNFAAASSSSPTGDLHKHSMDSGHLCRCEPGVWSERGVKGA